MLRKPKFKPEITRVALDPEQAVLMCDCYAGGLRWIGVTTYTSNNVGNVCFMKKYGKEMERHYYCNGYNDRWHSGAIVSSGPSVSS